MIEYLSQHPHVIVLLVTLLIWLGIALYLWRLDRRLDELLSKFSGKTVEQDNNTGR
ncbi:MAG: CcmD family protein [Chlorobiota bacterium]|jgi:CcmD family protein|nr:MAG: CcmD family protein [Chlorobiota bacterium]